MKTNTRVDESEVLQNMTNGFVFISKCVLYTVVQKVNVRSGEFRESNNFMVERGRKNETVYCKHISVILNFLLYISAFLVILVITTSPPPSQR